MWKRFGKLIGSIRNIRQEDGTEADAVAHIEKAPCHVLGGWTLEIGTDVTFPTTQLLAFHEGSAITVRTQQHDARGIRLV